MKELKIGKMLIMAFAAPLLFIVIYIWSLQFRGTVPPLFCFVLISLFVLAPLEIAVILNENRKVNGKIGVECALTYKQKMNKGKMLLIIMILFCIAGIASKFVGTWEDALFAPLINRYVPDYFMAENFICQIGHYPKSIIAVTTVLFVIANSFVLPITEELFFNGYMMPKLQRFKSLAPVIITFVFSLYHFWSPWQNVRRLVGVLPYIYMVWKKENIYIGIFVHCLCNLVGSIEILIMVINAI